MDPPHDLDAVVTTTAAKLMAATVLTAAEISQGVLADLVRHFDVDVSFLRYNDHAIGASRLVAEWPPRSDVPQPDPLAVVHFTDVDPVFAQCQHAKAPAVFGPRPACRGLFTEADGDAPTTSMAAAPLVSGEITTGTLGFVKFGDRLWRRAELNALAAIASLFAQVQARIAAEEQLRYLAHHDELTGLRNRRGLLAHLLERRLQRAPVAVLFLDLDRLKIVNDDLGHTAGDDVIRATAQRLQQTLRPDDVLARLGGDEFVASLVAPTIETQIAPLTERIHACLAEPLLISGASLSIGASIGVVVADPHDPRDPVQILRDADTAMYAAKNTGGGRTHYIDRASSSDRSCDGQEAMRRVDCPAVIDQAIGILRAQTGDTTDEAFRHLERMSELDDAKLEHVATHIVDQAVQRAHDARSAAVVTRSTPELHP